jgi:hypothetical protein
LFWFIFTVNMNQNKKGYLIFKAYNFILMRNKLLNFKFISFIVKEWVLQKVAMHSSSVFTKLLDLVKYQFLMHSIMRVYHQNIEFSGKNWNFGHQIEWRTLTHIFWVWESNTNSKLFCYERHLNQFNCWADQFITGSIWSKVQLFFFYFDWVIKINNSWLFHS